MELVNVCHQVKKRFPTDAVWFGIVFPCKSGKKKTIFLGIWLDLIILKNRGLKARLPVTEGDFETGAAKEQKTGSRKSGSVCSSMNTATSVLYKLKTFPFIKMTSAVRRPSSSGRRGWDLREDPI